MEYAPWVVLKDDLDLELILYHFYQLSIAFLLALPIALNRESRSQGAGLRTFPLVAIAACGFMLLAKSAFGGTTADAKVMYGVITGIGFIGGGAIIKHGKEVGGTATAAGIWNTGAIGVTVAYGYYEIAIVLSVCNFIIFQLFTPLKRHKPLDDIEASKHDAN